MRKKTEFKKMIIAVGFDGVCVTDEAPNIGKDIGAAPVLKALIESGHDLILWTERENKSDEKFRFRFLLDDAIDWFGTNGIPLHGINKNPDEFHLVPTRMKADWFIDVKCFGCPQFNAPNGKPIINWVHVYSYCISLGIIQNHSEYNKVIEQISKQLIHFV